MSMIIPWSKEVETNLMARDKLLFSQQFVEYLWILSNVQQEYENVGLI